MSGSHGGLVYVDSSAFTKLVTPEAETAALRRYLRRRGDNVVSADLLRTEVLRAATRLSPQHVVLARHHLRRVGFITLDRPSFDHAGILHPAHLRSLDAVHVAAALSLGDDLDEFVAYDARLVAAAQAHGLVVVSPS